MDAPGILFQLLDAIDNGTDEDVKEVAALARLIVKAPAPLAPAYPNGVWMVEELDYVGEMSGPFESEQEANDFIATLQRLGSNGGAHHYPNVQELAAQVQAAITAQGGGTLANPGPATGQVNPPFANVPPGSLYQN